MDFVVELGVADLLEQRGELRTGGEAVPDQIGPIDKRKRIEAFGGPG